MTHVALFIGQLVLAFLFGYFILGIAIHACMKAYFWKFDPKRAATLNDILRMSTFPRDHAWITYCERMLTIMRMSWYERMWVEIPSTPPPEPDEWGTTT